MILVTGATGRSGRHFVEELARQGFLERIRFLVRDNSDMSVFKNVNLDFETVVGDLRDVDGLEHAFENIDTVLHIASIRFSLGIVEAALRANVERIILVHTAGIYSNYKAAASDYLDIEAAIRGRMNMAPRRPGVVILRPTMIFGDLADRNMYVFIRIVDHTHVLPLIAGGANLLQPVHARDLGVAYSQVLANSAVMDGEYILSGERPISMRDMMLMLAEMLDRQLHILSVPLIFGVFSAHALRAVSFGRIDYLEKVRRLGENRSFPHEDATRDFGYSPAPLIESVQSEVDLYLSHKAK